MDTQAQAFSLNSQRAPWVATYLQFVLIKWIKWIFKNHQKPQTHKHSQLVRLPGGSLGGYLPTFYIIWILLLWWLPTYILK